jgi:hypothetical protein
MTTDWFEKTANPIIHKMNESNDSQGLWGEDPISFVLDKCLC